LEEQKLSFANRKCMENRNYFFVSEREKPEAKEHGYTPATSNLVGNHNTNHGIIFSNLTIINWKVVRTCRTAHEFLLCIVWNEESMQS